MNQMKINDLISRIILSGVLYIIVCIGCYDIAFKCSLFRSFELMGSMIFAEFSTSIILMIQQNNGDLESLMGNMAFWIIFIAFTRSVQIIVLNAINQKLFECEEIIKKIGWSIFLITLILGYLFLIVYCLMKDKLDYTMFEITFAVNLLFMYFILGGCYVFLKLENENQLQKREIELLSQKAKLQMEQYEQINAYKKQIAKVYHDLKNHVLVAGELTNKVEKEKYLSALSEYFEEVLPPINSGNEILDVLIDNKRKTCIKKQIQFEYKIDFAKGTFMNLIDVCIIFGNALDNAIEACERVEECKTINLTVGNYEEFIYIKIENSSKQPVLNYGKLVSSKKYKEHHGLGLDCMTDSLNKYQGTYSYEIRDKKFLLSIIIPITQ